MQKGFRDHWYNLSTGVSSVVVEFTINTSRHRAIAGLYVAKGKDWYRQLKDNQDAIEKELGASIEWSEGEKDGRMLLTKDFDAAFDKKEYKPYFEWFMEKALLLKKIANQYNAD